MGMLCDPVLPYVVYPCIDVVYDEVYGSRLCLDIRSLD